MCQRLCFFRVNAFSLGGKESKLHDNVLLLGCKVGRLARKAGGSAYQQQRSELVSSVVKSLGTELSISPASTQAGAFITGCSFLWLQFAGWMSSADHGTGGVAAACLGYLH